MFESLFKQIKEKYNFKEKKKTKYWKQTKINYFNAFIENTIHKFLDRNEKQNQLR